MEIPHCRLIQRASIVPVHCVALLPIPLGFACIVRLISARTSVGNLWGRPLRDASRSASIPWRFAVRDQVLKVRSVRCIVLATVA